MTDLSREAKALVDLARDGDDPTDLDRARIRRAVAAGIAAGAVGHSGVAAAASKSVLGLGSGAAGKTSVAVWLVAGALAGLAGSAAVFVAGHGVTDAPAAHTATLPARAPVVTAPAQPTHEDERATPTQAVAEPLDTSSVSPQTAAPGRVNASPARATGAASQAAAVAVPGAPPTESAVRAFPAPRPSTLGAETSLLEAARTALGQGNPAGALSLLERHEREFPAGALVEERLAAKVFALCGL